MNKTVVCFVIAIAAAVCPRAAIAQSLVEASKIYRAELKDAPPSVQEKGDYIFVIVEGDPSKSRDGSLNRLVMEAQLESLKKYIGDTSKSTVSPLPGKISNTILPLIEFKIPAAKTFSVDRTYRGPIFRDVTAFEAAPIKAAKEAMASNTPVKLPLEQWEKLVKSYYSSLNTAESRNEFLVALGTVIPLLSSKGTVVCASDRVHYSQVEEMLNSWSQGPKGVSEAETMITVIPSHGEALRVLAEKDEKDGDVIRALTKAMKANAWDGRHTDLIQKYLKTIAGEEDSSAWNEYMALFNMTQGDDLEFGNGDVVFSQVRRSSGRAGFAVAQRNDGGAFAEAKKLFEKGENLPKIITLLEKALCSNPSSPEIWRYYGAALRTAHKYRECTLAYQESLSLNPKDPLALSDIGNAFQKLGLKKLADANAWYLLATSEDELALAKARRIIRENHLSQLGESDE